MNRITAENNRVPGPSAFRAVLRFCCALIALLLVAASAAGESVSWEERLKKAREKYNKKTVNVYVNGYGYNQRGKINVRIYTVRGKGYKCINIRESLKISDEAEMQAILEVIAENKYYSEEVFGTISFMKAQWITHNIAYSMATGSEEDRQLIETLTGESIREIVGHAEELDLSPLSAMTEKQIFLYGVVEFSFCHR